MATISICMIVRNEENVLSRCLTSVRGLADEIIIVDTGSTDRTKEIAIECGATVYDYDWNDNFSDARNASFGYAKSDYIMWLDADDCMSESNLNAAIKLKNSLDFGTDIVMMKYRSGNLTYYRERLIKNRAGFYWTEPVHEVITPHGNIVYSDITIDHKKISESTKGRNLKIYRKYIAAGNKLSPRSQFYYARELMYNGNISAAIRTFDKFLLSGGGWIENIIEACKNLSYCYLLRNDRDNALRSLFRSFAFSVPRKDICKEIADIFFGKNDYADSKYWYLASLSADPPAYGAFVEDPCDLSVYIGLSVSFYYLRDMENAAKYHALAKSKDPQNSTVIFNDKFF